MKTIQKSVAAALLIAATISIISVNFISEVKAQGVGINSSGTSANPSAILDVSATNKGVLFPRLTTGQRDAITSPAEGLQIFNTTTQCLEMYLNGGWATISCPDPCSHPDPPSPITGKPATCPNNTETYNSSSNNATTFQWTVPSDATITSGQGTGSINVRFGTTSGMVSVKAVNYLCSSAAVTLAVSVGAPPAPIAGTNHYARTQILWNWKYVNGVDGTKFNTVNDYNSATDNGTSTTYTQTGLSPNTTYHLYVWAYKSCGVSPAAVLTQTTASVDGCPNAWVILTPGGGPPAARASHAAVWNPDNSTMLVFGGYTHVNGNGSLLNDLWSYSPSGNTWTQLSPSGGPPAARDYQTAVWDAANSRMLVFGGNDFNNSYFNDLWSYSPSGNTWTQLSPSGGPPSGRLGHTAVWNPASGGNMLVFGGYSNGIFLNDLWSYSSSGNTWTQLSPGGGPPAKRYIHSAVWDAANSRMLVFGGYAGGISNDLWSYSPSGNTWTQLNPSGGPPDARYFQSAVWDAANSRMLLFDGYGNNPLDDLWSYSGNTWVQLSPSGIPAPSARYTHTAVWDIADGRMLVFGGYDSNSTLLNELWSFCP